MSDPENAAYRLLSFKYTPTKLTTGADHPAADDNVDGNHDGEAHTRTRQPRLGQESELPSLSSLAAALPVVDATPAPAMNQSLPTLSGTDTQANTVPDAKQGADPGPDPPAASFHIFGDLPAELRIKIWHLTFLPRVVELHPTRPNYARDSGRQQQWQSGCSNPAALSVSSEARQIALGHFRIAYPLASITSQQEGPGQAPFARYSAAAEHIGNYYNFSGPSATGKAILRRRTLHISPEVDTVALLGQDIDLGKISALLDSFRDADPQELGLSNLALSTRGWGYPGSAAMMRSFNRTILKGLGQLTLFMYGEPLPPHEWNVKGASLDEQTLSRFRETGNRCELVPCEGSNAWYAYKLWSSGKGRQFWNDEGKIMQVGRNDLKIMDLKFSDGW
ncbi:hypothetical protein KVR01_009500 [Diaporthe batatas]|uniref:uncharacterized protein n=1 Tax=Diaporthe batatas TaxID=748121 RepID=UPI001D0522E5|nr:uncharacterized protein KVR01_009500 [Diaporthe batatas]KAG8161236.1 hypothetical protein KVR01_009500 [Diaporthe batatas]